jgi:hypothetical protein
MGSDGGSSLSRPRENRIKKSSIEGSMPPEREEDRVKLDVLQFELLCQWSTRVVLRLPEQR